MLCGIRIFLTSKFIPAFQTFQIFLFIDINRDIHINNLLMALHTELT